MDLTFIEKLESELKLKVPEAYLARMKDENGGVITTREHEWKLFPFLDKSDIEKMIKTCVHIGIEIRNALAWDDFPREGVAVGKNVYGDLLFLLPERDQPGVLSEIIYVWVRESRQVYKMASNINMVAYK